MKFVVKRKVDELGRIVLPIDYRNHFKMEAGNTISITSTPKGLLIKHSFGKSEHRIDELGRIVIPAELRSEFAIEAKSTINISATDDGILLTPEGLVESLNTADEHTSVSGKVEAYDADYSTHREKYHELMDGVGTRDIFDEVVASGVFAAINQRKAELPHIINYKVKEAYEKSLDLLNIFAANIGARIHGEVNYNEFDAVIKVCFRHFEFFGEWIKTIRFVAENARSVSFTTAIDGTMVMTARFEYFEDVETGDIILEEIQKRPELVETLMESAEREKKAILSDPQMYAFLEKAVEGTDITPEEYIDLMDDALREDPSLFGRILHDHLMGDNGSADTDEEE